MTESMLRTIRYDSSRLPAFEDSFPRFLFFFFNCEDEQSFPFFQACFLRAYFFEESFFFCFVLKCLRKFRKIARMRSIIIVSIDFTIYRIRRMRAYTYEILLIDRYSIRRIPYGENSFEYSLLFFFLFR